MSTLVKVVMNTAKYMADLKKREAKKMRLVGEFLATEAQRRCPVGKYPNEPGRVGGALKGSIYSRQPADDIIHVVASQEYAADVEYGTDPHSIKNAWGSGRTVQHPGTEAQPYLRPAVYENGKKIERLLAL